jgi:hypothetical protein
MDTDQLKRARKKRMPQNGWNAGGRIADTECLTVKGRPGGLQTGTQRPPSSRMHPGSSPVPAFLQQRQVLSSKTRPQPKRRLARQPLTYYLLVGGCAVLGSAILLMGNLINPLSLLSAKDPNAACQGKVQSQSVISREQLSQLLMIPERDRKVKVRRVLKAPYCILPSVEVRAGVKADREAYPLAFDPQTRLIVLYEGEEYAGYSFDVVDR